MNKNLKKTVIFLIAILFVGVIGVTIFNYKEKTPTQTVSEVEPTSPAGVPELKFSPKYVVTGKDKIYQVDIVVDKSNAQGLQSILAYDFVINYPDKFAKNVIFTPNPAYEVIEENKTENGKIRVFAYDLNDKLLSLYDKSYTQNYTLLGKIKFTTTSETGSGTFTFSNASLGVVFIGYPYSITPTTYKLNLVVNDNQETEFPLLSPTRFSNNEYGLDDTTFGILFFKDKNENGIRDTGEDFNDVNGNGICDTGEDFNDVNGNKVCDYNEEALFNTEPITVTATGSFTLGQPRFNETVITDGNGIAVFEDKNNTKPQVSYKISIKNPNPNKYIFKRPINNTLQNDELNITVNKGLPEIFSVGVVDIPITVTPTITTASPSITLTTSPTISSPSGAFITINGKLPGIGTSNLSDNKNPVEITRTANLQIIPVNGGNVIYSTGEVKFNGNSFSGVITVPNITSGNYQIKLKFNNTLYKLIPGIYNLSGGKNINTPVVNLNSGDILEDGVLNLRDYMLILSCVQKKSSCSNSQMTASDLDLNGKVENADLNILLAQLKEITGD